MREFMIIKLRIYHQKCKLLVYNVKKIEQRTECFQQTETWCQLYINVKFLSLLHSTSLAQERVFMSLWLTLAGKVSNIEIENCFQLMTTLKPNDK